MTLHHTPLLTITSLALWLCWPMATNATNLTHAVSFNGSNQYARLPTTPALLTGVDHMSGEVWFKTTTAKNQKTKARSISMGV